MGRETLTQTKQRHNRSRSYSRQSPCRECISSPRISLWKNQSLRFLRRTMHESIGRTGKSKDIYRDHSKKTLLRLHQPHDRKQTSRIDIKLTHSSGSNDFSISIPNFIGSSVRIFEKAIIHLLLFQLLVIFIGLRLGSRNIFSCASPLRNHNHIVY